MRHHNYDKQHDEIITEMHRHAKTLPKVTKTIGRPKINYSKIEKIWIDDYDVNNCQTLDSVFKS